MKGWVKTYILKTTREDLAEAIDDEYEKKHSMAIKSKRVDNKEILYHELISRLNCDFGKPLEHRHGFFYYVFGSVLADLPEAVFTRLCTMKNLFFVYTPNSRAETKLFELKNDITEQKLQVVLFPYDSEFLPSMVLRGQIVHELVHVHTGVVDMIEEEDQIDSIATKWGFEEEIKRFRDHHSRREPEKGEHLFPTERKPASFKGQESPRLIVKRKQVPEETVYEIKRAVTTIGRRPGNDILLKHRMVSRRHAEICFEDDGYFLYDIASTNGTRINGRYIQKERLSDGDLIQIGPFIFTFTARL